jgi:hypothetical protein
MASSVPLLLLWIVLQQRDASAAIAVKNLASMTGEHATCPTLPVERAMATVFNAPRNQNRVGVGPSLDPFAVIPVTYI